MNSFSPFKTVVELGRQLRSGQFTSCQLTTSYLKRIEQLDSRLGAFKLLLPERAMAQAQSADTELAAGVDRGPLHGIPYAVKDLFDVAGYPTTAGCPLLESNIAERDAAVIQQLNNAGAVLLGKTKTVQFAYGGVGINSHQGTPHNPWQSDAFLPGGSSSGSGVAVASGMVPMALGTDTGGSVRIPAAFNGISGLKTTVGQVSRSGVYPLSWSLDSVGPLTRTVEDAALVYQAIAGEDIEDNSTREFQRKDVLAHIQSGVRGLKLAFAEQVFFDDADDEVSTLVRAAGSVFQTLGAELTSVNFTAAEQALALNPQGLIIAAEAYTLNQNLVDNHAAELDPLVVQRMLYGKTVTAHEYLNIARTWDKLRQTALAELAQVDALLCPTVMNPATPVVAFDNDLEAYMQLNFQCLRNTSVGNILNLCAVTVPCGFTRNGLPAGLMIYGKSFDEASVLRVGHAFQQATGWHTRTPEFLEE